MPPGLPKQSIDISFAQGLDTKTDPKRVQAGKFLQFNNAVFSKQGLLQKRNGFGTLATIGLNQNYISTFQNSLIVRSLAGLNSYSEINQSFTSVPGLIYQCSLSALPILRNSYDQTQCDSVTAANGFVCTVYTEKKGITASFWYTINDSITGQNVVPPTSFTAITAPRVFLLGSHFIIVYTVTTLNEELKYIAINTSSLAVNSPAALGIGTDPNGFTNLAFDGVVSGGVLYIVLNGHGGTGIKVIPLSSSLVIGSTFVVDGSNAGTVVTITTDGTNLYCTYLTGTTLYMTAVTLIGGAVFGPTSLDTGVTVANITSIPSSVVPGSILFYYEVVNNYGFDSAVPTNYIKQNFITSAGSIGLPPGFTSIFARGVGLASKVFLIGQNYVLTAFQSPYQNTYFLLDELGSVVSKFASANGGGYATGLPYVSVSGNQASIPYLFKDFIVSVNNGATNVPQTPKIYSQTGINLAAFNLGINPFVTSELGSTLNLCGGFLWNYDGLQSTENNFFLYPDRDENVDIYGTSNQLSASSSGGSMTTQDYYYQIIYCWTDNQGNKYRSTPSLPIFLSSSDLTGSSNSVVINIPTLRLTFKTNVTIEVFRWSMDQSSYYAIRNFASNPLSNNPAVDYVSITDTAISSSIVGNELIYTTGSVAEDTSGPACSACTIFDTRLWLIDSEDGNLLWYSKQVIEGTPVEMSDLFTLYISPSISAQGPTGPLKCLAPMDDKLILFKATSGIYYINGTGPDITGANSQYSQPIFITSTLGSTAQNSIVMTPMGLIFQETNGQIWLLGRDLSTQYIGAPVEDFTTGQIVISAQTIPETTQVRFLLNNGKILMYDYFFQQWGTFSGITTNNSPPLISSCLYNGLQTLLDSSGNIYQETLGTFVDGTSNLVQMNFQTSWIKLSGLQGYQRVWWAFFIGDYISAHVLDVNIAYDYVSTIVQPVTVIPDPTKPIEQWQIGFQRQTCQAIQLTVQEVDSVAGAGLTLSGMNLVIGVKKSYPRTLAATQKTG